mgnify:CR=1 FL=1
MRCRVACVCVRVRARVHARPTYFWADTALWDSRSHYYWWCCTCVCLVGERKRRVGSTRGGQAGSHSTLVFFPSMSLLSSVAPVFASQAHGYLVVPVSCYEWDRISHQDVWTKMVYLQVRGLGHVWGAVVAGRLVRHSWVVYGQGRARARVGGCNSHRSTVGGSHAREVLMRTPSSACLSQAKIDRRTGTGLAASSVSAAAAAAAAAPAAGAEGQTQTQAVSASSGLSRSQPQ